LEVGEMKRLIVIATLLALGMAGTAIAGTRVAIKDSEQARRDADMHARYDHPKTQVVKNDDLKIDITRDQIISRSRIRAAKSSTPRVCSTTRPKV
jgi:hypothetical protein